ncbi:hypothetical protein JOD54_000565 [Actinokineospora baliensis]|uniref:DUF4082 domain-containing protein n=1 Tax=Actinokineospora baliensis TaxID=547056 RepID=UPI001959142D|nr:DUF4082 domain-containing protein [Actinokineospora baliensis]MBM7770361.1 hypothetical protein [Actinokineospora baliensis]
MLRKLAAVIFIVLLVPVAASADAALGHPDSFVQSPLEGNVVPLDVPVVFAGVAGYTGTSPHPITAVEVSFDDGDTWELADGTDTWSLVKTLTTTGPLVVTSRAWAGEQVESTYREKHMWAGSGPLPALNCTRCEFWQPNRGDTTYLDADPDARQVEVGTRFQVDRPGHITAVMGFNYATGEGTQIGRLWSADGELLAEAPKSSGIDFVFDEPVPVEPGKTYIASYYTPWGHYAVTEGHFTAATVQAPFTALPDAGVYRYLDEDPDGFPSNTYEGSYYWVMPVFTP